MIIKLLMKDSKETLAEFVKRVREKVKRLSLNEVVAKSGGLVSNAYVSKIENGLILTPSVSKLKGLAKGLGITEEELISVAQGTPKKGLEGKLEIISLKFGSLPKEKQSKAEPLIDSLDQYLDSLAEQ
jgi:transcriptional regulator with XRE-family HTH domain